MGVPGFFVWVSRNSRNTIVRNCIAKTDQKIVLYIDCNCCIHPECFNTLNYYNKLGKKLCAEKLTQYMFDRIKLYIDYLITISNANEVFIAIDGVAPMAKINQQRKRRFKSAWEKEIRNEIGKKHNKEEPCNIWDNTCITPGTEFMEKLHLELERYIKTKNMKITYSSYHIVGEGEHKILQKIKNLTEPEQSIIYGLDADLLFLALASGNSNIYLLREEVELNKNIVKKENNIKIIDTPMIYVSIDELKKSILNIFEQKLGYSDNYMINDFIVICYLLGNDFIPHIPSINIKNHGIDDIIWAYCEVQYRYNKAIYDDNIDIKIFGFLLEKLSNIEINCLDHNEYKKEHNLTNPYDIELWELDNMFYFGKINDTIELGKGLEKEWKHRYYTEYFGSASSFTVKNICEEYCSGIKWVTEYYFKECCSWSWQYRYTHGPFISDVYKYLIDIDNIKIPKDIPLKPLEQLVAVLPPSQYKLLPEKYQYLITSVKSPIIDYYPKKFKLDMIHKGYLYLCVPLLPAINRTRLIEAFNYI